MAALDDGLSRLTYGSVSRRLGISDRVIVYYFPTKDDLIVAVLAAIGATLQAALGAALSSLARDHLEFVAEVWPSLARPDVDPAMAAFFEASGLAAAGVEPYRSLAGSLVEGWVSWAEHAITGSPQHRRSEAASAIAVLDGLLLLRQLAGEELADRAARALVHRS